MDLKIAISIVKIIIITTTCQAAGSGNPCETDELCQSLGQKCLEDGKCKCPGNSFYDEQRKACFAWVQSVLDKCTLDQQCFPLHGIGTSLCNDQTSQCECKDGHYYDSTGGSPFCIRKCSNDTGCPLGQVCLATATDSMVMACFKLKFPTTQPIADMASTIDDYISDKKSNSKGFGTMNDPCQNDSDCEDTLKCSKAKCLCPRHKIPSADSTKCLGIMTDQHGHCEENNQCIERFGQSYCDGRCKCKFDFVYFNGDEPKTPKNIFCKTRCVNDTECNNANVNGDEGEYCVTVAGLDYKLCLHLFRLTSSSPKIDDDDSNVEQSSTDTWIIVVGVLVLIAVGFGIVYLNRSRDHPNRDDPAVVGLVELARPNL